MAAAFEVESPNTVYTESHIESRYTYETTSVETNASGRMIVKPQRTEYTFRVERKVPRVGVMLVGWGGKLQLTGT